MSIKKIVAFSLFIFSSFLILISGFRVNHGADTETYRNFYQYIGSKNSENFLDDNIFEYGFVFLVFLFNLLTIEFDSFLIIVALFSFISMFVTYINVKTSTFIIFCLLYLSFIYWQLQWSVLRQAISFWVLVLSFIFFKKRIILALMSSTFHISSIFSLLIYKKYKFFLIPSLFAILISVSYFFIKYLALDLEVFKIFFGDSNRWLIGLLIYITLYLLIYKRWNFNGAKIISIAVAIAVIIPIGWRVLAVILPVLLLNNNRDINFRLPMHAFLLFIIFLMKSYSHYLSSVSIDLEPEIIHIFNLIL